MLTKSTTIKKRSYSVIDIPKHKQLSGLFSHKGGIFGENIVFLTGSSGAGKTTFILYLLSILKKNKTALYERESSAEKIRSRNEGLDYHNNFFIDDKESCETLEVFLKNAKDEKVDIICIDSLQACASDYENLGPNASVEKTFQTIKDWVEETKGIAIVIGQVTKENEFAGKNVMLHYVDIHIEMIFDKKIDKRYIQIGKKQRDGNSVEKLFYKIKGNGKGFDFYEEKENDFDFISDASNLLKRHIKLFSEKGWYPELVREIQEEQSAIIDSGAKDFEFLSLMIKFVYETIEKFESNEA